MKNFKFNEKLYGINIIYYKSKSGEISIKCCYKNGKREGEYIYYENGNIWYKCYYKNDNLEGEYIKYYVMVIFGINIIIKMTI
jgi:antitoxin component YwqK of YwqJK toxin-antitoxin module